MVRRFRTAFVDNEARLQHWLNAMAGYPECEDSEPPRPRPARQVKIEHIQLAVVDGGDYGPVSTILVVISRLEDEDES